MAADAAIFAIADRDDGVVSCGELLAAGVSREQIARRRTRGLLRPSPHRGVFLVGHANPAPRALLRAALKAVPGSALAGLTSATRHEASQYAGTIELVTANRNGIRRPGLRVHRCPSLREEDVTEVDGLRCTTPHRMCLEVAAGHPGSLFRVLNECERLMLSTGDLRGASQGQARAAVEAALARLQPGGQELRSPKEADLLTALAAAPDLPAPSTNAWLADISVDFLWPDAGLVVLVDGAQDHLRASVFDRDRRVDNALADLGHHVRPYPSWRIDRDLATVVAEIAGAHRALRA